MNDQIIKNKYLTLEQEMIKLTQKLDELSNANKEIIKKIKDTITIDNKIIKENDLNLIANSYLQDKNTITNNIISNIKSKIS